MFNKKRMKFARYYLLTMTVEILLLKIVFDPLLIFYNYNVILFDIIFYIVNVKKKMSGKGMNWPIQDGVYMDSSYKLYYPPGTRWSLYGLLI